jgi:sugar phosphate isomerase/epimerase
MQVGLFTDAFTHLSLTQTLAWCAAHGIESVELGTGGYSPAPHADLERLSSSVAARHELLGELASTDVSLGALNVSGNPLHPDPERAQRHDTDLRNAIRLAAELAVDRVVAMSGCPGAGASDRVAPHFSGGGWLPDLDGIADWQWRERVAPYWSELSQFARREHPSLMVCFELHPGTYVYNVETFKRVRRFGSNLGVNLDPSHFFWQSMDPLAIIQALGDDIGHVHGKDTTLNPQRMALNGLLDSRWPNPPDEMPWNFATVGRGHDREWWARFVALLQDRGFSGTISIEYEDPFVPVEQSVLESAQLLAAVTRN